MPAKNTRRPKGDGTIFQKDGRWVGRLTYTDRETGLRRRREVSGATKKQAAERLKELAAHVKEKPRDDARPFSEYVQKWIDNTLEVSDRKPSTKALYAGLARTHIAPSPIGKTLSGKLTAASVERFVKELRARGLSESTVRQIYTVGRAIGDTAVRDRVMASNPFREMKRPKVPKTEAAYLTAAEVDRLLEAAQGSRYALVFDFLMATALRRGEALALRWVDVNMADEPKERPRIPGRSAVIRGTLARIDGELVVGTTKTETSRRTVPLSDDALDVLRRVRVRTAADRLAAGSKWVDTGFVFTTELGEPCDPRNALRALARAAELADLGGGIGLHTLRHSAATMMLNNGVPVAVVSKLLGHSSIQVTVDIYGHEDEVATRGALDALAAARAAARENKVARKVT